MEKNGKKQLVTKLNDSSRTPINNHLVQKLTHNLYELSGCRLSPVVVT